MLVENTNKGEERRNKKGRISDESDYANDTEFFRKIHLVTDVPTLYRDCDSTNILPFKWGHATAWFRLLVGFQPINRMSVFKPVLSDFDGMD